MPSAVNCSIVKYSSDTFGFDFKKPLTMTTLQFGSGPVGKVNEAYEESLVQTSVDPSQELQVTDSAAATMNENITASSPITDVFSEDVATTSDVSRVLVLPVTLSEEEFGIIPNAAEFSPIINKKGNIQKNRFKIILNGQGRQSFRGSNYENLINDYDAVTFKENFSTIYIQLRW